jgi:hypothetical protein
VLAHSGLIFKLKEFLSPRDSNWRASQADLYMCIKFLSQQYTTHAVTREAVELARERHLNLSVCGYALGACLAELSVYFCSRELNYELAQAFVFDSPGLAKVAEAPAQPAHDTRHLTINTYLTCPNMLNAAFHSQRHRCFKLAVSPSLANCELSKPLSEYVKRLAKLGRVMMTSDDDHRRGRSVANDLRAFFGTGVEDLVGHFIEMGCYYASGKQDEEMKEVVSWPVRVTANDVEFNESLLKIRATAVVEQQRRGSGGGALVSAWPEWPLIDWFGAHMRRCFEVDEEAYRLLGRLIKMFPLAGLFDFMDKMLQDRWQPPDEPVKLVAKIVSGDADEFTVCKNETFFAKYRGILKHFIIKRDVFFFLFGIYSGAYIKKEEIVVSV